MLLLRAFVPDDAPIVVGIDETIERRCGAKIAAKSIYRYPVCSSQQYFVKTSSLRWVTMQWLVRIRWVGHVWALPFLTVLAPSARYHQHHGKRHKKVTDWGRQLILQLCRWLPYRTVVPNLRYFKSLLAFRSSTSRSAARAAIAIAVSVGFFSGPVVKQLASTTMTFGAPYTRFQASVTPYFGEQCIRMVPP